MQSATVVTDTQLIDPRPFGRRLRPGNSTEVELPGGWRLRHHAGLTKRHVLEVFDARRDLVGLLASNSQAPSSIDAAWRGCTADAHPERRWWSLAVGHVDSDAAASVTFLGRLPGGRPRRTTVTPIVVDGLWVAMVSAHREAVTLQQGKRHYVQRIAPTLRGCA